MNFIYNALKPLVRLALKSYFRSIKVVGEENIPDNGPAVVVANHPSAFMDPLLITILFKNEIHFIAGAEWFGKGIKAWIYKNLFNMIPVIRPHLVKDGEELNNDEMFQHCYERLDKNGIILIFPEGNSITEFRLRTLKTGVARIVTGAENYMKGDRRVKVIPVGLNYENPHVFQRDLIITIGNPVDFSNCENLKDFQKVRAMTDCISEAMQKQLWHIPHPELDDLVIKLRKILSYTLPADHNFSPDDAEMVFNMHQEIIEAVKYYNQKKPALIDEVNELLNNYFAKLREVGISERDYYVIRQKKSRVNWLFVTLIAPLAIPSMVLNIIPYFLTRITFRKKILPEIERKDDLGTLNPSFSGSMIFILGLAFFLGWYLILSIVISVSINLWWLFIPVILGLHALGILALRWVQKIQVLREKIRFNKIMRNNVEGLKDCLNERTILLHRISELKEEYLSVSQ